MAAAVEALLAEGPAAASSRSAGVRSAPPSPAPPPAGFSGSEFDLRSDSATKLFTCYSFSNSRRHVRLNTIAIDPRNPCYFSIGGSDEYVRLYDMRFLSDDSRNTYQPVDTFCPKHLMGGKVHITGIAYSYAREILVSYNDEHVYLFQSNMVLVRTLGDGGIDDGKMMHEAIQRCPIKVMPLPKNAKEIIASNERGREV
ncbi:hypothetical protein PR202_gb29366 [Eleusine coracana subsp. coracana]|uniref:Uncharacterized protein n=1 Tax=Eleusine coracana subsp. coracana TaxID=191504 RepID=A0AAV5G154_ELECO|nr:hypothetical protein PR202_gb29366 [Eleusine coracana subsp. coracana]